MARRVVITGLGVITPVGFNLSEFWSNLCSGVSGIDRIKLVDVEESKCQIGGEVRDFDPTPFFDKPREAARADRFIQFAMAASKKAVAMAGIDFAKGDPERAGVYLGSGIGGLQAIESNHTIATEKGYGKVSPFAIPMLIANAAGGLVAKDYGIHGPNLSMVSACATGTHGIGEAWRTILFGDADVMIAGGSESPITPLALAAFANMRALSTRNDDPKAASRPFDSERDGFVMGEGAGVAVLEEYEHAKARGADILCEITGYGMSGDAFHPTLPHPDGYGASLCMTRALKHAQLDATAIDYVNAHATSTPQGDVIETRAIKNVFASHATDHRLAISSTKSMTGHLLGAAGGVEVAACALAIRDGVIPPTINLENPDPECDLDYVPLEARAKPIRRAMSNSFGFGGTNATLVLEAV